MGERGIRNTRRISEISGGRRRVVSRPEKRGTSIRPKQKQQRTLPGPETAPIRSPRRRAAGERSRHLSRIRADRSGRGNKTPHSSWSRGARNTAAVARAGSCANEADTAQQQNARRTRSLPPPFWAIGACSAVRRRRCPTESVGSSSGCFR